MRRSIVLSIVLCLTLTIMAQRVCILTSKKATNREQYAAEYLKKKLTAMGYEVTAKKGLRITLTNAATGTAEGYAITKDKQGFVVSGNDATGVIYGCVELADRIRQKGSLDIEPVEETPGMVMRGTCIGMQKTVYLPGHAVYEYPYTPENFPWFYDKQE